jgi:uncharacterized caspase-like protein
MLRIWTCLWFSVCGAIAMAQLASASDKEQEALGAASDKRVGLVIGNSAYRHIGVLPNPANDAREMGAALRRMAVKVEILLDADRTTMLDAITRLSRAAESADLAIVHYSGHGIEINGKNYLVPIAAELNQAGDADREAIAFEQIYAAIERVRGMKLILLDACRDNPFAARLGLPPRRGLSAPSPPGDILVAYATRHGSVAEDGRPGGNSPFTAALLKSLDQPVDVRLMFRQVLNDVLAATDHRQSPFIYGHLTSAEYSLVPKR